MSDPPLSMPHSSPSPRAASLPSVNDLLITDELAERPKRTPRDRGVETALRELSREIGEHPANVLPRFVELAMRLCGAGAAGISVYEPQPPGPGIFRWTALSGMAARFHGQATPRDFSPCGICLDRRETILIERPSRYYDWLDLPDLPITEALLVPLLIKGDTEFGTLWVISPDEHRFDAEDARVLTEMSSVVCLALGLMADTAEKENRLRKAEEALQQSQKLEALGQLTLGIVHDFNNLLTVLTGDLELIKGQVQGADLVRMVDRGLRSAERGDKLVQHLLAFARRRSLAPELIDLRAVLIDIVEMLVRSLPNLKIKGAIADDLWPVVVDQQQLESAILNLAINARDAMSDRGSMSLSARNVRLRRGVDDDRLGGDFVALAVSDTGAGMSPELVARAFEPFFTTKEVGTGTGLGLGIVRDFATQSGGEARIQSDVGKGTTITLYLPRGATPAN